MTKAMESSKGPQPWAVLHRVKAPTLITWGLDDRVSPLDMALIPMRTIPNAELHVFPNCGHWTMIEAKDAFESVVLAFLLREGATADGSTRETRRQLHSRGGA
jgi:pimeloyl-ACP methyl ester carboxylesterase